MPAEKTSVPPTGKRRHDFVVLLLCLGAVLSLLFHPSFRPEYVVFSNDGPLGATTAQAKDVWGSLRGSWQELNWLGGKQPGGFLTAGYLTYAILGPLLSAKFLAPISLLFLGLSAWVFFRQLGFHSIACVLGGMAAALNMDAFSSSCWGVMSWTLARASIYLALAALPHATVEKVWVRAALAGFAVGLGLMDGLDVGALYSLYIAAFVLFQALIGPGTTARKFAAGLTRVALVAVTAALIAAQALSMVIGTQIKGVVGMEQDAKARQARWEGATQWSLPKVETLRIIIPGLFGYRIPELYGEPAESANGSNYWGAMGEGPGQLRHSGGGEFAGVLVTLVAVWAGVQSFRRKDTPFTDTDRKFIKFWGGAVVISLLLAFGKYAPFYQFVYDLPYFSTMRNPFKFLHPLHVGLVILFAYGLQGLCRRYLTTNENRERSALAQVRNWWKTAPTFDKRWTMGCIFAVVAGLLGWLVYAASQNELIRRLQQIGFPGEQLAASVARFSLAELGLFVLFLGLSAGTVTLIMSGAFSGRRAKWAGLTMGMLLVIDLARADARWIVYWNYKQKYSSNPIIDQLREKPYEYRVSAKLGPASGQFLVDYRDPEARNFIALYFSEWLQHHFQYYRVQSLDIIQMPRVAELDQAYMQNSHPSPQAFYAILNTLGLLDAKTVAALGPRLVDDGTAFRCARLWQLTNTRYILAAASSLDQPFNSLLDPAQKRLRVISRFNVVPKPGIIEVSKPEHLTAAPAANGKFALFEFTGALPRARLFARWQINTNDDATLAALRNPDFDPAQTVFVANELPGASPTNSNSQTAGAVEIERYEPKFVRLTAEAAAPSVLLLNDRHHPDWKVWVDGKPETLLRCNYIMRGVYLSGGKHRVEFRFQPPLTAFYISLTGLVAGVVLCGYLVVTRNSAKTSEAPPPPAGHPAKNRPIVNRRS